MFNDAARGALPTLYAATADIASGPYVAPHGFQPLRGYPQVIEARKNTRDTDLARR